MSAPSLTELKIQIATLEVELKALSNKVDSLDHIFDEKFKELKNSVDANTEALSQNTEMRNKWEGGLTVGNRIIILSGVVISAVVALFKLKG